jgi:small nuclear ribonucleoprotein (snRNP)-like protein
MNVDEYIESLELEKTDTGFFKCPYCDYTNIDARVVRKHIKSKHYEEIEKMLKNSQSKDNKNKNRKDRFKRQRKKKKVQETIPRNEIKDYVFLMCHNKRVKVVMRNGTEYIGTLHCKDPYTVLIDIEGEPPKRKILNKAYIQEYELLEE